jgi:ABC-type transport system substrate-binding protein
MSTYLWNGTEISPVLNWYQHNANYTHWVMHIRPGLKWSDGSNVTATDLLTSEGPKFAFNASYNFEGLLSQVTKEYAINGSTVVFDLNASQAHLLNEMALDGAGGTPVLPASVISQYGASYPNLGTDLSMGPFYVYQYTAGTTQMVMYRNPYFTPQPKICEIQVAFVDSLSLTTERLQAGATDFAPIDPSTAASILKTPNLHVLDEKAVGAASLQYNDSVYPYSSLAFRQALMYGINQSQFIQTSYSGYGVPGYDAPSGVPVSAGMFYNPNTVRYSFDPAKAASLLQDPSLGWTKGSDGLLHYSNGTAVTLNLWTDTDNTEDLAGAPVVVSNLQKLGLTVNLHTTAEANIVGDYAANTNGIRNALILFSGYVLNPPNALVDGLEGWNVEWGPTTASHHWLNPPSLDAQYYSNKSAVLSTSVPQLEQKYLFNIEAMEASSLPTTILAYPDFLWGYSTAQWTNWPNPVTGHMDEGLAEVPNMTAWETLTPVAAITTTTSPPTTTSAPTTTLPPVTSNSTTTAAASSSPTLLYLGAVVVVIVILAGVALAMRGRRPKTQT